MGPHGCQQLQRPSHIDLPVGQGIGNRFTHGLEPGEVDHRFHWSACLDFAAHWPTSGLESPIQSIG